MITGRIRAYSSSVSAGLIHGDDGNLYPFALSEWLSTFPPLADMLVRFEGTNGQAVNITLQQAMA